MTDSDNKKKSLRQSKSKKQQIITETTAKITSKKDDVKKCKTQRKSLKLKPFSLSHIVTTGTQLQSSDAQSTEPLASSKKNLGLCPYSRGIVGARECLDTEKAIKASLETYKHETSKRKLIMEYSSPNTSHGNKNNKIGKRRRGKSSFNFIEFLELWKYCEETLGFTTSEIENGSMVRKANHSNTTSASKIYDIDKEQNATASISNKCMSTSIYNNHLHFSSSQPNAQYGRLYFPAMKKIIEFTNLSSDDIFIDIGHGIGNATLQCAFTVGCESRGVEIVPERCRIAEQFFDILSDCVDMVSREESGRVSSYFLSL